METPNTFFSSFHRLRQVQLSFPLIPPLFAPENFFFYGITDRCLCRGSALRSPSSLFPIRLTSRFSPLLFIGVLVPFFQLLAHFSFFLKARKETFFFPFPRRERLRRSPPFSPVPFTRMASPVFSLLTVFFFFSFFPSSRQRMVSFPPLCGSPPFFRPEAYPPPFFPFLQGP